MKERLKKADVTLRILGTKTYIGVLIGREEKDQKEPFLNRRNWEHRNVPSPNPCRILGSQKHRVANNGCRDFDVISIYSNSLMTFSYRNYDWEWNLIRSATTNEQTIEGEWNGYKKGPLSAASDCSFSHEIKGRVPILIEILGFRLLTFHSFHAFQTMNSSGFPRIRNWPVCCISSNEAFNSTASFESISLSSGNLWVDHRRGGKKPAIKPSFWLLRSFVFQRIPARLQCLTTTFHWVTERLLSLILLSPALPSVSLPTYSYLRSFFSENDSNLRWALNIDLISSKWPKTRNSNYKIPYIASLTTTIKSLFASLTTTIKSLCL